MQVPHLPENPPLPHLRGISQIVASLASLLGALWILGEAPGTLQKVAAALFGFGMWASFTASALLHRVGWGPRANAVMRTVDHSMIYVVIAASFAPVCLLVLPRPFGPVLFGTVAVLATAGIAVRIYLHHRVPRNVIAVTYLALGLTGVVAAPEMVQRVDGWIFGVLLVGGVLYVLGGLVFLSRWPNPAPRWFGFHECFHVLVLAAATCMYVGMYPIVTSPVALHSV